MAQNYDDLENQIGDLGGEPQEESPLKGKKLQHKAAYGQKEDLDESEQDSMNKFLQRTKTTKAFSDAPISQGWIPLDRAELGKRSLFYPDSYEFYVRPATVQAIKNWTAIDEERADVLNKVFNEIIKSCVKIVSNGEVVSWGQLNSWDRFWFVLKVREYTFA